MTGISSSDFSLVTGRNLGGRQFAGHARLMKCAVVAAELWSVIDSDLAVRTIRRTDSIDDFLFGGDQAAFA